MSELGPELQEIVDRAVANLRAAFFDERGLPVGLIGLADDLAAAVQLAIAEPQVNHTESVRAALDRYREGRLAGAR